MKSYALFSSIDGDGNRLIYCGPLLESEVSKYLEPKTYYNKGFSLLVGESDSTEWDNSSKKWYIEARDIHVVAASNWPIFNQGE